MADWQHKNPYFKQMAGQISDNAVRSKLSIFDFNISKEGPYRESSKSKI
jgi:hypothetical protein